MNVIWVFAESTGTKSLFALLKIQNKKHYLSGRQTPRVVNSVAYCKTIFKIAFVSRTLRGFTAGNVFPDEAIAISFSFSSFLLPLVLPLQMEHARDLMNERS